MNTQIHTEFDIRFVGEQDGRVEQDLKTRWRPILAQSPAAKRAYLALVSYDRAVTFQPALCIKHERGDDRALAEALSVPFHQTFNSSQALDIMFLSPEQEAELSKVCRAFYDAA
jgi:hypothetical protein